MWIVWQNAYSGVMDHKDARRKIGEKAFEVYEKFFSIEAFNKKLNEIVTEIMQ